MTAGWSRSSHHRQEPRDAGWQRTLKGPRQGSLVRHCCQFHPPHPPLTPVNYILAAETSQFRPIAANDLPTVPAFLDTFLSFKVPKTTMGASDEQSSGFKAHPPSILASGREGAEKQKIWPPPPME